MYNDIDFYEAAADIAEQVVTISDPQLAITVEKWLTKLTSANSGSNELNYLKLLRIMVTNRRICRPFLNAPPGGPLMSLSRYINPSPYDDRGTAAGKSRMAGSWRMISCSRAAQTDNAGVEENADDEVENGGTKDNDGTNNKDTRDNTGTKNDRDKDTNGDKNQNKKPNAKKKTANSDIDNSDADREKHKKNNTAQSSDVTETDDPRASNNENSDKKKRKENDKAEDPAKAEKGLHLAAGGGEECDPYWAPLDDGSVGDDDDDERSVLKRFCDPCVDCLGQHLKKNRPKSPDKAYGDLLEDDCVVPALTDVELTSVEPELARVLKDINNTTTLQEFYYQVSAHTCDQGATLMKVADELLDDYRAILSDVFDSQTEHISDGLAREQMALNGKYTYLEHRTLNRATVALEFLRDVMPMFDWYKYDEDPDAYLKRTILQQSAAGAADDGDSREGAAGGGCGGGGGGGGGDEDGVRHAAVRKLLYGLNMARAEMTRVDVEHDRLLRESDALTADLDRSRRHWSEYRCRSSNDVNGFKVELVLLRKRSADLMDTIGRLTKSVQAAMQNKRSLQSVV